MLRESNILRLVVALILVSVTVACSSTPSEGTAELLVTGDFGQEVLADVAIATGPSLLGSLQNVTTVETAYGGGFVAGMFGRSSSSDPRADWFYFVDGRLAETGARGRSVGPGQHIWWDHRRWGAAEVRAVVGAWPAPFVRNERAVYADPPMAEVLRKLGAEVTAEPSDWEVLVGSDADLRMRSERWRTMADDPGGSGSAATISGTRVRSLDVEGAFEDVPGGAAIAVALPGGLRESDGLTLAIAGVDASASRAAAAAIAAEPSLLSGSYAVVFDASGGVLRQAGRR